MDSITLFVLALGLSMDAFAVSISNSMCFSGLRRNEAALTSLSFGVFQGLMPVAGYFAGRASPMWCARLTTGSPLHCWASSAAK